MSCDRSLVTGHLCVQILATDRGHGDGLGAVVVVGQLRLGMDWLPAGVASFNRDVDDFRPERAI